MAELRMILGENNAVASLFPCADKGTTQRQRFRRFDNGALLTGFWSNRPLFPEMRRRPEVALGRLTHTPAL
jgi:hypothetical protein